MFRKIPPSRHTPPSTSRPPSRHTSLLPPRTLLPPRRLGSGWPLPLHIRFAIGTILVRSVVALLLHAVLLLPDFKVLLRTGARSRTSLVLGVLWRRSGSSALERSARWARFRSGLRSGSAAARFGSGAAPGSRTGSRQLLLGERHQLGLELGDGQYWYGGTAVV